MSVVKTHRVKYRLADKLRRGPGIGVAAALARAEAAVAGMRDQLLAEVDTHIAAAEVALAGCRPGAADAEMLRLSDCGERLIGIAGACGMGPLADASLGLCDLIDWMQQASRFEAEALAVHVAALRLLRSNESTEAAAQVLGGLARVRARYLDGDPVAS